MEKVRSSSTQSKPGGNHLEKEPDSWDMVTGMKGLDQGTGVARLIVSAREGGVVLT